MLARSTLLVLALAASAHGFSVNFRPLVVAPSRHGRSALSMIEPMNSGYSRGGSYGGSSQYSIDADRQSRSPGIRNNFYDKPVSDFKRPYGQRGGSSSYETSRGGSYDDPDYGLEDRHDQDDYRDSYSRDSYGRGGRDYHDRDRSWRSGRAGGRNSFQDMGRRAVSGMRDYERRGRSVGMRGNYYDNDSNRRYGQRGGSSYDMSRGYRRGSYPDPYASTRRGMINYDFDNDYENENNNGYGPSYGHGRRSSYNNDYSYGRRGGSSLLDMWEDRYDQDDYRDSYRRGGNSYNGRSLMSRLGGRRDNYRDNYQGRDLSHLTEDQRRALMKLNMVQQDLDSVHDELDGVHTKLDTVLGYARASDLNYDGSERA